MRLTAIVLYIIGVVGIIFGIVWAVAIFPRYEKIPSDFSRTDEFEGTYTLPDPILQQIQSSQVIRQLGSNPQTLALLASENVLQFLSGPELPALLADAATLQDLVGNLSTLVEASSPDTMQLLSNPQVQQFLTSPELAALLASPATLQSLTSNLETLQQAMDPATVALLADPTVQQLLANPDAIQLLTNPTVLALLADPIGAIQSADPTALQLLANPIIQGLLANPTLVQALASPQVQVLLANPNALQLVLDPTVQSVMANPIAASLLADSGAQQLLANPSALRLLLNPTVQAVLANPAVPALLGDAAIQELLGDPESLRLVTDPRTMRLLRDPADLPVIQIPVLIHRERVATGNTSGRISINEQVTTTRSDIGDGLEQFPKSELNLLVERGDKVYMDGTGGGRTGGLAFPFGMKKDTVYPTWVSAARQPLDAKYVSTETIDGLEIFILEIDVANLEMPAEEGDSGSLVVDSQITIRAEPHSGRVVDVEDHATTVSVVSGVDIKSTIFVSDVEYTQETVDTQLKKARDDVDELRYFGTSLPRLNIVPGILFILLGAFIHQLPRLRGTRP